MSNRTPDSLSGAIQAANRSDFDSQPRFLSQPYLQHYTRPPWKTGAAKCYQKWFSVRAVRGFVSAPFCANWLRICVTRVSRSCEEDETNDERRGTQEGCRSASGRVGQSKRRKREQPVQARVSTGDQFASRLTRKAVCWIMCFADSKPMCDRVTCSRHMGTGAPSITHRSASR